MNTEIINVQEVEVDCLVANQPIGPMYIAVMDCGTLEYRKHPSNYLLIIPEHMHPRI